MTSPASIRRHPIHPMLIPLPIGLWVFSLVCDIVFRAGGSAAWDTAAYYAIGVGIIGALLAAVPGFIDYLSISEPYLKGIATWHLGLNLTAVVLFAISFGVRARSVPGATWPFILSIIGIVVLVISGWLGGTMVYENGMAVSTEAREPRGRRAA